MKTSTPRRPRGQPQKYPWQQWIPSDLLDGSVLSKTLTLKKGKDFECQPHGMVQMFRNRISRRKLPLTASGHVSEKSVTITLERKS